MVLSGWRGGGAIGGASMWGWFESKLCEEAPCCCHSLLKMAEAGHVAFAHGYPSAALRTKTIANGSDDNDDNNNNNNNNNGNNLSNCNSVCNSNDNHKYDNNDNSNDNGNSKSNDKSEVIWTM